MKNDFEAHPSLSDGLLFVLRSTNTEPGAVATGFKVRNTNTEPGAVMTGCNMRQVPAENIARIYLYCWLKHAGVPPNSSL